MPVLLLKSFNDGVAGGNLFHVNLSNSHDNKQQFALSHVPDRSNISQAAHYVEEEFFRINSAKFAFSERKP
eukprot:13238046-Ditylum_brightwellii.AAC.1